MAAANDGGGVEGTWQPWGLQDLVGSGGGDGDGEESGAGVVVNVRRGGSGRGCVL